MRTSPARSYTRYTRHAAELLGKQIALARKDRKLTQADLASRAGIARATLIRIEKGDLSCEIGSVFELAALVGIKLFEAEAGEMGAAIERVDDKIALLPRSVRSTITEVDDDF